jgi:mycofactocin biosynthetic radical S-adenosylmethionine protein MftC
MTDELTKTEFDALWPQIVNLKPKKVIITGGEPLIRADIFELIRALCAADPEGKVLRCLNTNGHLVTTSVARMLVGLIDEVRVSLDAMSISNDSLRGPGNFKAALRAIDMFYAAGFEPKVLITLTSVSLPDLEELVCLLLRKGINRINMNPFHPVGRGARHPEWHVDLAEAKAAVKRARRRCGLARSEPVGKACRLRGNCGVGQFLNIMPNGDVFPCHVLTRSEFRCGNVRDESLRVFCQSRLLGQLADLEFSEMAVGDPALQELSKSDACMGFVYRKVITSPEWLKHLSLSTGNDQ